MRRPSAPHLTLEAFARTGFMKEFKRRSEQAAGKATVILLKGLRRHGRNLRPHPRSARAPWLDLSGGDQRPDPGNARKGRRRVLFVPDLAGLGKLQQMNLAFALDRLESSTSCSSPPAAALSRPRRGRLGRQAPRPPGRSLGRHAEPGGACRRCAGDRRFSPHPLHRGGEVPARRFASNALNALRTLPWKGSGDGGWSEPIPWSESGAHRPGRRDRRRRRAGCAQDEAGENGGLPPPSRPAAAGRLAMPSSGSISNFTCASKAAT